MRDLLKWLSAALQSILGTTCQACRHGSFSIPHVCRGRRSYAVYLEDPSDPTRVTQFGREHRMFGQANPVVRTMSRHGAAARRWNRQKIRLL
jgi:hypothetical protein